MMEFRARYGAWAIAAGASEGLGAAYARELAARGLNLVLVARRADLLQSVAAELSERYGVETKTLALDLSAADAAERVASATSELKVGLLVYNAAYSSVGAFLEKSIDDHLRELIRISVRL